MILALVVGLIFILVGEKAVGKGFVLGALFSIINFMVMGKFIPMKLGKSRTRASFIASISLIIRYALLAIPLLISYRADALNFFGVMAGLFVIQLSILIDHLFLRRFSLLRKV